MAFARIRHLHRQGRIVEQHLALALQRHAKVLAQQARGQARAIDKEVGRQCAMPAGLQRGDVTDLDSLRTAMVGVETVFHVAADTNTWRPNNAAQTRTNVGGATNLVQAAREAAMWC